MENSYDEECFKKWEIDECEAEMEKVVQWIGKRKLHGRVRVAFIEESYERQGYRMGIPKQVYVSRVLANIRTWLYIDEFHTVLDREYSAKFLFSLWKKVRKQGGLCTGITQNLVDMLQNYTAMTMLGNSEFIALLKQSNVDSQELSTAAGIPEAQLKYVDNSPSGTGIIKYGNTCIPFDNRMEKEANPLYALFNTNLHEKALQTKQE